MDGRRLLAGEDAQAGRDCPDWCDDASQGIALFIRRYLIDLVSGCEPPRDVWDRILALVSRLGRAQPPQLGRHQGPM